MTELEKLKKELNWYKENYNTVCNIVYRIYGDNYYTDEDEDLILRCPKCNMNPDRLDDDYID